MYSVALTLLGRGGKTQASGRSKMGRLVRLQPMAEVVAPKKNYERNLFVPIATKICRSQGARELGGGGG